MGWADENGDWLRNILYLSKSTTAIGCGACPPSLFIRPAMGWADENGDWLRNILYLSKSTTAIGCGACPPFHQTSHGVWSEDVP